MKSNQLEHSELLLLHDQGYNYFQEKWGIGEVNERKMLGKNWSADEEAKIKAQDRQPYSMPIIQTKLNTISATQKQSRTSFKVEAVSDPNDEIKAELATLNIKDVEKRSNFKYVESDVFDKGLSVLFGYTKMDLEYKNGFPSVVVKEGDWKNLTWDINAVQYGLQDGLWMAELEKRYRFELEAEGINTKNLTEGDINSQGREKVSYYVTPNPNGDSDYDIISVFTHYQKVIRNYYVVIFEDTQGIIGKTGVISKHRTKEEANRKLKELNWEYVIKGFPEEGSVELKKETRLDRYRFTYNTLIDYEETELERFPFDVYFAFKVGNDFTPFLSFLESPQIFFDRVMSQIDFAIGKSNKEFYGINTTAIDQNVMTIEEAMKLIGKNGAKIPMLGGQQGDLLKVYAEAGVPSHYFELLGVMMNLMDDLTGGRNFQGLAEGRNEPGVAVEKRRQMGMKIALNFIDNLSRWKKSVGENILWWIQNFQDVETVIKVEGASLSEEMLQILQSNNLYQPSIKMDGGYLTLNKEGVELSYLKDADFELLLSEAELTETERMAKLMMMMEAEKADPLLQQSPTWRTLKLERMDIPVADRKRLMREMEAIQQAQQVQAEKEMDLKKAEILSRSPNENAEQTKRLKEREQMLKQRETLFDKKMQLEQSQVKE